MNTIERVIMGFVIFLIFVLCISFGNFIYVWINNYRLNRYIKNNDYEKWRYLTMIGKFGPGLRNPVRGLRYIYGKRDNENETVLDFTMGSGSTIKASLNTNRKAIGIELGQCEKKGHKYFGMDWTDVLIDQLELE